MNNKFGLLGGIAVLQMVLVAVFWFGAGGADSAPEALLDFVPETVDQLDISDTDNKLVMTREDTGWEIGGEIGGEAGRLPADATKLDELLKKMAGLTAPWPVAQSAASAERFEVREDNFQRHVVLRDDGEVVVDLYLGTSPGYQRVHARRADSDDVYSIGLSNFELAPGVDSWLDKSLLALADAPDEVTVEYAADAQPTQTLTKQAAATDAWLINGTPADQDAATTYVNRFVNLQVLGVADADQVAQAARVATIRAGDATTLTVLRVGDDGDYLVRADAQEAAFRLATYIAEQLLMNDLDLAISGGGATAAEEDAEEDAEEVVDELQENVQEAQEQAQQNGPE